MNHRTLSERLETRFKALFDLPPKWAWPFVPSIPFVGEHYRVEKGLLVYASAENLAWMNEGDPPARFTSEVAWNRYRAVYEERGRDRGEFFPDIGIAPASDGGLVAAALFVASRTYLPTRRTVRSFLETLAITNWCKFTVRHTRNRDYLTDRRRLAESLGFVVAELAVLQPAVALVPKTLWPQPLFSAAMRGASSSTFFIAAPQCNAHVVNIHLASYAGMAGRLRKSMSGSVLASWIAHARHINTDNLWRYVAFLDQQTSGKHGLKHSVRP